MLWTAGVLAVVAGMPELGGAIFVIIVTNGVFAFVQEHRAERASEHLEALLPRRATVRRGGQTVEIDARKLVVGDQVLLTAGDRICADLRIVESHFLRIDASLLTGESEPLAPELEETAHAGTHVVAGEGTGVVMVTGGKTRLAELAALTTAKPRQPTPLARELHRLVRTIALIAVSIGAVSFLVSLLLGLPASAGFLFGIGVIVALVPEGLLPTVTLSLAVGARRMAAKGALVRRLEAVEALGSTTFICTDKTGTLTENRMSVVTVWTPRGTFEITGHGYEPAGEIRGEAGARGELERLSLAAARCSTGRAVQRDGAWIAVGDPMEAALHVLALRAGVDVELDERARPISRRYPFDSVRRRMSLVIGDDLVVKGAPDAVMLRCTNGAAAGEIVERLAARGLRVLAIAARSARRVPPDAGADEAESELELLGIVGLEDPLREGAARAIAACRQAGMKVAMITGDHPGTAGAVARKAGLGDGSALCGDELPEDDAALGDILDRDGVVVSRVSPEQKLRIATVLKSRGHVVAMTGDGVNDGPALHQADVGIAMGKSGTDVAREAADLVLLEDDFATIIHAITQGRSTFANIRKFLAYHLTDNVAELAPFVLWALSGGRIPLALGVLQILTLDLVTDQLPALALGVEAPIGDLLEQRPFGRHLVDRGLLFRALGVLGLTEALVSLAAFGASFAWPSRAAAAGTGPILAASGAAFTAVVVGQVMNAFACRSEDVPSWRVGGRTVSWLPLAVAVEVALLAVSLSVTPIAHLLGQRLPSPAGFLVALLAIPAIPLVDAAYKWLLRARGAARGRPRRSAPAHG
jgi:magnesium-transporting ATPase (P-type)